MITKETLQGMTLRQMRRAVKDPKKLVRIAKILKTLGPIDLIHKSFK